MTMTSNAMNNKWLGVVRMPALGCLLLIATLRCEAQNLVPNPSFEEADTCLVLNTYYYPETGPIHWFTAGGSTDHFQSCLPYGAFNGVPLNVVAFQYPSDGLAYGGFVTYNEQFGIREYWMVELIAPLVIGQTYYASFRANAAYRSDAPGNQSWITSSGVGMLFTMESRQDEPGNPLPVPLNYSHISHDGILNDTAAWVLVSGTFVADSAYRYVMLGNHFDNANTDTLHLENLSIAGRGYTLIDDVCVSQSPTGCPLATAIFELPEKGVVVYPNPARDLLVVRGIGAAGHASALDALGRSIWHSAVLSGQFVLEVGGWARGSYVLRVSDAAGVSSYKFVLTE